MTKIQIRKIAKLFGILKFSLAARRSTLTEGQRFPNACCAGFDVEILMADNDIIITRCHNPQCPNVCGCGTPCPYDGVTIYGIGRNELPEYLMEAR